MQKKTLISYDFQVGRTPRDYTHEREEESMSKKKAKRERSVKLAMPH